MLCLLFQCIHHIIFILDDYMHFVRRLLNKDFEDVTVSDEIAILFAGVIGALAFTFSGIPFWFSAVEGEVYSMSSMFIALLVWLITKWENEYHDSDNERWAHSNFLHYRTFCRSSHDGNVSSSSSLFGLLLLEIMNLLGRVYHR